MFENSAAFARVSKLIQSKFSEKTNVLENSKTTFEEHLLIVQKLT